MSMIGELSFFLGLQVSQSKYGVFISQSKYLRETLKKDGLEDCKSVSTPMVTSCSIDDRKSTSGATFFLGNCLVSWVNKKQDSISLSTVEAEYIAVATCCSQILWMKRTLKDIKVELTDPIPIMCDNTSAISIYKNPIMHSKTKHIPIKFHFLREQVAANIERLEYVATKEQLVDIFTKPLARDPFVHLKQQIGVVTPPPK
eukprot:PITA_06062